MYMSLYGYVLPFLLDTYLGEEWLDHIVGVCLTFMKLPNCFQSPGTISIPSDNNHIFNFQYASLFLDVSLLFQ